jgi:hypothetical protein
MAEEERNKPKQTAAKIPHRAIKLCEINRREKCHTPLRIDVPQAREASAILGQKPIHVKMRKLLRHQQLHDRL